MKTNEAILAFSQSEKLKVGTIWISQALGSLQGLQGGERKGGEKMISVLLHMIVHEIKLARAAVYHKGWDDIEGYVDRALTMVNSGVGQEAVIHMTRALSKITNIGQESMSSLREKGLL